MNHTLISYLLAGLYSTYGTSASLSNVKHILCNNWGYLDLREARVVYDKSAYSTRLAKGTWTVTSNYGKKKTYDFSTMSEKQWRQFKNAASNWVGVRFKRTAKNVLPSYKV
jgi:hypothetical protein